MTARTMLFLLILIIIIVGASIMISKVAAKKDQNFGDYILMGLFSNAIGQAMSLAVDVMKKKGSREKSELLDADMLIKFSKNCKHKSFKSDYKHFLRRFLLSTAPQVFLDKKHTLTDFIEEMKSAGLEQHVDEITNTDTFSDKSEKTEKTEKPEKPDYIPERIVHFTMKPTFSDTVITQETAKNNSIYYYLDKYQWSVPEHIKLQIVDFFIDYPLNKTFFKLNCMDVVDVFGTVYTRMFPFYCGPFADQKYGCLGPYETVLASIVRSQTFPSQKDPFHKLYIYMPNDKQIYKTISIYLTQLYAAKKSKICLIYKPKYMKYLKFIVNNTALDISEFTEKGLGSTVRLNSVTSPFTFDTKPSSRICLFIDTSIFKSLQSSNNVL